MASYRELLAQRDKLDAQIEEFRLRERREALNLIWQKMDEHGVTIEDIKRSEKKTRVGRKKATA